MQVFDRKICRGFQLCVLRHAAERRYLPHFCGRGTFVKLYVRLVPGSMKLKSVSNVANHSKDGRKDDKDGIEVFEQSTFHASIEM